MEKDIIEFYPDNKKIALFALLIILGFFSFPLFIFVKEGFQPLSLILTILILGITFFLLAFFMQKNNLILILTKEGIINRYFPIICWNEINDISFTRNLLKIYPKQDALKSISSHLILPSKLYLFIIKKLFKKPHIRLRLFLFSSDSIKKIQEIANQYLEKQKTR